jgi:MFS transporter, DHA1 family, inner membrane transport protein
LPPTDGADKAARAFDPRVWLLAFGTFAVGTDSFGISGILPAISRDLGVSIGTAGLLVTAYAATYAVGAPLLAAVTDRVPRGTLLVGALILTIVADIGCALSSSFALLMVGRVFAGIAAALYTPAAYALATSLARTGRTGSALAAVSFGLTTSAVLGVPAGTFLSEHLGWAAAFWFVVALAAVSLAVLFLSRISRAEAGTEKLTLAERFAPLWRPRVLLILLPGLLWAAGNFASYTYLGAAMAERHSPNAVLLLFLIYGAGGMLGSQLGGWLADRYGSTIPVAICLSLGVLIQLVFGLAQETFATFATVLFLWSFTGWATFAPQQSRLLTIEPSNAPVVIALNNSTVYLGSACGATLGALLLARGVPALALHWATGTLLALALVVFCSSIPFLKIPRG